MTKRKINNEKINIWKENRITKSGDSDDLYRLISSAFAGGNFFLHLKLKIQLKFNQKNAKPCLAEAYIAILDISLYIKLLTYNIFLVIPQSKIESCIDL